MFVTIYLKTPLDCSVYFQNILAVSM